MQSDWSFRRWSAIATAVSAAVAVLAILHLLRHYSHADAYHPRWLGLEWLLAVLASFQFAAVVVARFAVLRHIGRQVVDADWAKSKLGYLEKALTSISDGFAIWNAAGQLVIWNRRYEELTDYLPVPLHDGMTIGRFISLSGEALFPDSQVNARTDWIEARQAAHARATGAPQFFATPSGRQLEIWHQRVADDDVVTVLRDITEEYEADQRLTLSERRFRDGIESMADGFLLWDAQDRLLAINRRARELLPHLADMRMLGRTFSECVLEALARGRPELDAAQRAAWLQVRQEKRARREPHDLHPPNGAVVVAIEQPTSEGGLVTVLRDVTVERRARELTGNALAMERNTNAQQRRFASIVAHEFRTPLAIIDSAAQRIAARLEIAPPAENLRRLGRIRQAVKRMAALIDMTLASRRRDGAIAAPVPSEFDAAVLLREVIARQAAGAPRVAIHLDAPSDAVHLVADRAMMEEVVTQLLSNAVKFAPQGKRIEVTLTDELGDVKIAVRDFGVGIPEDEIPSLFTRSIRARTAGAIQGTGIGLHLVNELVGLHGGHIAVASRPGEGSIFSVYLPRNPLAAVTATD